MVHFDIKLAKGTYSVDLHTAQIEDGFTNKIYKITPGTGKQTQSSGPKDNKVVDLLRITRSFRVMAFLLNNLEKNNLVKIIEGGGTDGGGTTLSYSDGGDSQTFIVFVESCIITQTATDYGAGWMSGQDYKRGNVVDYNGNFYNCILDIDDSTSDPATDTTHFAVASINDFAKFDINMTLIKGVT